MGNDYTAPWGGSFEKRTWLNKTAVVIKKHPSKSGNTSHETILWDDLTISCNCMGWINKRKCWHKADMAARQPTEFKSILERIEKLEEEVI